MARVKNLLLLYFLFYYSPGCLAQSKSPYVFQQDDTVLKRNYYNLSVQKTNSLLGTLTDKNKADYKPIYEERLREVKELLISSRTVTDTFAHPYLKSLVDRIITSNPELKGMNVRVVFSRDWWPNAYSIGEGTIAVNAGLLVFMNNEAELAFALCHELAHYYLDHGEKAIRKYVETVNSEDFQKELKRLSKQEYGVNTELEKLAKNIVFDSRRHSRDKEAEADKQGFLFMKRAGYDGTAAITTLQMLDRVDDTTLFKPLDLKRMLSFPEYPFKSSWTKKESAIFGAMADDEVSGLTPKEKDSLKTHPDCSKRIVLLQDSVKTATGRIFIINEKIFRQLKQDFIPEMVEECYAADNLGRNLYYSLQMLAENQHKELAIYSIARDLNTAYEKQKNHKLGLLIAAESRGMDADYNDLLRMMARIRLDEIAAINYYFCSKYEAEMKGYEGFEEEMRKAKKYMN